MSATGESSDPTNIPDDIIANLNRLQQVADNHHNTIRETLAHFRQLNAQPDIVDDSYVLRLPEAGRQSIKAGSLANVTTVLVTEWRKTDLRENEKDVLKMLAITVKLVCRLLNLKLGKDFEDVYADVERSISQLSGRNRD